MSERIRLDKDFFIYNSWLNIPQILFNREVIIIGGSYQGDELKFTKEERERYFFVQVNHHIKRRQNYQPCDWLIARQGSEMIAENFLKLTQPTRDRIKIISAQINETERYEEWCKVCADGGYYLFPFHENCGGKQNPHHPTLEWCNQFWTELRTNPFIGILAIKMILMFPIKSLKIMGFDFYQKPGGGFHKNLSCHNIKLQVLWLLHQYNTDFRIEIDDKLLDAFCTFGKVNRGKIESFDLASL